MRGTLLGYVIVFFGGGLGAASRHAINRLLPMSATGHFPLSTLIINVVGSFVMGLLAGWFNSRSNLGGADHLRLFLTTGILGGFTTFSAFSLDAAMLWQRQDQLGAMAYVATSVGVSLVGVFLGLGLSRAVLN